MRSIILCVLLYDTTDHVPVENLSPASVGDIKSDIFEDNCKTTITDNYAYYPGMSIFTNNQLQ